MSESGSASQQKCYECGKPADHNHHVVPKLYGGRKTIPLCAKCHGKIHDLKMTASALQEERWRQFREDVRRWNDVRKRWQELEPKCLTHDYEQIYREGLDILREPMCNIINNYNLEVFEETLQALEDRRKEMTTLVNEALSRL